MPKRWWAWENFYWRWNTLVTIPIPAGPLKPSLWVLLAHRVLFSLWLSLAESLQFREDKAGKDFSGVTSNIHWDMWLITQLALTIDDLHAYVLHIEVSLVSEFRLNADAFWVWPTTSFPKSSSRVIRITRASEPQTNLQAPNRRTREKKHE